MQQRTAASKPRVLLLLGLGLLVVACYKPESWAGMNNNNQPQIAGIIIDSSGVLSSKIYRDPTGQLTRQRLVEAQAKLAPDLLNPSPLRKISLNRLEAELAKRIAAGDYETDDMKYLAGLTSITHVFFYPDSNDIVIAGPAEGYYVDLAGRPRGIHTGQAVLELQDLVAALRAYSPAGTRTDVISVSIDPTQEGLENLQRLLNELGGFATPAMTARIAESVRQALGRQVVTLRGVSDRSHFGQVLVEADYRMKLISIGLEKAPVKKISSYAERAPARSASKNALTRFYFMPDYECVRVSEDGLAMQLTGQGVKLVTEQELVNRDGTRKANSNGNKAAEQFATAFTENYPELAKKSPIYAQLKNLIDITIAAAFIQQQGYYSQADWQLGVLGDESKLPIETYTAPKFADAAVNALWKGTRLMTPVGGGVKIQARQALVAERLLPDEKGELRTQREQITVKNLAPGQWWWD